MIERNNSKKEFKLTKDHNIDYYNHSYFKNQICMKKLINNEINKESSEKIRYALLKLYFIQNSESTEEQCKLYFKQYLKEIIEVNETIDEEIKKCKISSIYTNRSHSTIVDKIIYLKDLYNNEICYLVAYEHYNKIKKENEKLNMYFIMNKNKCLEIKNKDVYQFFGDATYRCTPPTFRAYKLYVISGYNFIIKRSRILAYILIPNETYTTYNIMFNKLKSDFGFRPKIFTVDFNKSSAKAIKIIFQKYIWLNVFFILLKVFGNI